MSLNLKKKKKDRNPDFIKNIINSFIYLFTYKKSFIFSEHLLHFYNKSRCIGDTDKRTANTVVRF